MRQAKYLACAAVVCIGLSVGMAKAQLQTIPEGSTAQINGVISARNGPQMTIRQADNTSVVAVLDDSTQVRMKEGHLGFRKKQVDLTLLLPGLRLEVSGIGNANGQLMAQKVVLTQADLQAAREIQAGNAPIEAQEQQLAAQQQNLNQQEQELAQKEQQTQQATQQAQQSADLANQRINNLNNYTTKYRTVVYFGSGKTAIPPDARPGLDQIASQAVATNAYMIQIAAYASTSGSAKLNEELSNERADSVIAYLTQSGHIPIYRILAPAAMGASTKAGADEALNRRVVVKVVVNQGIAQ